jgi:chemotaxis protein MotB
LVTYADLLTLLMVLFLVLWVISNIDKQKFEEFKSGLGDFGNPAALINGKGIGGGLEHATPECLAAVEAYLAQAEEHAAAAAPESGDGQDTAAGGVDATEDTAAQDTAAQDTAAGGVDATEDTAAQDTAAGGEDAAAQDTTAEGGDATEDAAQDTAAQDTAAEGGRGAAAEADSAMPLVDASCVGPGGPLETPVGGGYLEMAEADTSGPDDVAGELSSNELAGVAAAIEQALAEAGVAEAGSGVRLERRGLVISVSTDGVLFGSGDAAITAQGRAIIGALVAELAAIPNHVVIEGHTDSRPIVGRGDYSNWDLSVDRALSVLKMLTDEFGLPADRLAAIGYGEHKPLDPSGTDEALARNRRVEILIVSAEANDLEAPVDPVIAEDPIGTGATSDPASEAAPAAEPATAAEAAAPAVTSVATED